MELDEDGLPITEEVAAELAAAEEASVAAMSSYQRNLAAARQLAKDDPRIVATVLKAWVSDER